MPFQKFSGGERVPAFPAAAAARELSSTAAGPAAAAAGPGRQPREGLGIVLSPRTGTAGPRGAVRGYRATSPLPLSTAPKRRAERPCRSPTSRQRRERGLRAVPALGPPRWLRGHLPGAGQRGRGERGRARQAANGAGEAGGGGGGGGKGSKQHVIPAEQRGSRGRG